MNKRYLAFSHGYGRPVVQNGPMSGCLNFPSHHHTRLNQRPVGLKRAIETAKSCPHHAMVYLHEDGTTVGVSVYDNGKAPYTPEGWTAETWNGRG